MQRTEAVELVASTIAKYPHVTHLRLTTRGSITGRSRVEVMTLGQPGAKRPKGTREQEYVGFDGDMFAPPGALPADTWKAAFAALDPDILLATGCAQQTGFDVDATGTITNRHGSKTQAEKANRKYLSSLDAKLDDHEGAEQRLARVRRGDFDPSLLVTYYPVTQQPGRIDAQIMRELGRKHDELEDAPIEGGMLIDLDSVLVDYSAFIAGHLASPARAEFKRQMLQRLTENEPTISTTVQVDTTR